MSRLIRAAPLAVVAGLVVAGCSSPSASSDAPTTTVPLNVEVLSDPQAGAAGEMLCQTTGFGGGAYYLLVTSMTGQSTPACNDGTTFSGGQDMLDAMPGPPARRCELDVETYHAVVTVYSDDRVDDRHAAEQRCQEPGAKP